MSRVTVYFIWQSPYCNWDKQSLEYFILFCTLSRSVVWIHIIGVLYVCIQLDWWLFIYFHCYFDFCVITYFLLVLWLLDLLTVLLFLCGHSLLFYKYEVTWWYGRSAVHFMITGSIASDHRSILYFVIWLYLFVNIVHIEAGSFIYFIMYITS